MLWNHPFKKILILSYVSVVYCVFFERGAWFSLPPKKHSKQPKHSSESIFFWMDGFITQLEPRYLQIHKDIKGKPPILGALGNTKILTRTLDFPLLYGYKYQPKHRSESIFFWMDGFITHLEPRYLQIHKDIKGNPPVLEALGNTKILSFGDFFELFLGRKGLLWLGFQKYIPIEPVLYETS